MKKKSIWIITSVLLVTALVAGSVYAFYKGNIDGVWGQIDQLQYIDIIGQIGVDPGTQWGTDPISTADNTIRRNPGICMGDINGTDAFDPGPYGTGYADKTLTGLGSHDYNCNGNGLIISEYVETSAYTTNPSDTGGGQAIEIFNATNFPIALLGYKLQIYYDGSTTAGLTIDLTTNAILAAHDVWVVADAAIAGRISTEDQLATGLNYNGNDVVALVRGGNGVQDYEDAECSNWATGPTGTDPDAAPTSWQGTYWNQTGLTTDWNQVRYGRPGISGYNECGDIEDDADFLLQSGFGFNGIDIEDPLVYYGENQPFVMGVLCHYNNPIYAQSNEGKLQSVPLTVTVGDIKCDDANQTPAVPSSSSFTYYLRLDETNNTNYGFPLPLTSCPYRTYAPGETPCADGVFVSQPPANQYFSCNYGTSTVTYTIVTLGFMSQVNGACPAWNAADAERDFISDEGDTNCACMYGMIADEVPQAVELLYFDANVLDDAISLEWATASETDNFGFNLYRATALDGEQTQLNEGLIPSLVAPGSPYGAEYSFVDETAEPGVLYYYWLEDVELSMITTLHGPVEAIIE